MESVFIYIHTHALAHPLTGIVIVFDSVCGQWKQRKGDLHDTKGVILCGASKLVRSHSKY
jgi:hypothetical protein